MIVTKDKFFELQTQLDYIPFLQSIEWLNSNYQDLQNKLVYFIDSIENPKIACCGVCLEKRFIGRKLMIDGLCTSNKINSSNIRDFFKSIIEEGFSMITLSDIKEYSAEYEIGYRRAGFVRPLALSLCPMSLVVELQNSFSFHRNWKRNVKKSKETGNEFICVDKPTTVDTDDFVVLFNQLKNRKSLGFSLSSEQILNLLKGDYKLFFIEDKNNKRIAGRIVYVNKRQAYDVYAANSDEAIKVGAAYHIQDEMLNYLKKEGCEFFDYGRISPSNDEMDNIYVAKNYSGGKPIAYNGEWHYNKNQIVNYLYSFYRHVVRKQRIY